MSRRKRRKIVTFLAHDREACMDLIAAMDRNGDLVNLVLDECREIGGIGFLVFEEK